MEYEVVISVGPFAGEVFVRTHTLASAERFADTCARRHGAAIVRAVGPKLSSIATASVAQTQQ